LRLNGGPRWDKDWIERELTPQITTLKKIFVCGAPSMNETFDRAFEDLAVQMQLNWQDIEIL
jgi:hypothetical protein